MSEKEVLIVFYSRKGAVAALAEQIARGVNSVAGVRAVIRSVPPLPHGEQDEQVESEQAAMPPHCSLEDLRRCDGLCVGSPTRFGNMAAAMKAFWDSSSALWASGDLIDKPAAVFTSSSSMHGGNESTLLSMMLPLLHHGMLVMGVPYSLPALRNTRSGGTPYGPSHIEQHGEAERAGLRVSVAQLSDDEISIARGLGERMAKHLLTHNAAR